MIDFDPKKLLALKKKMDIASAKFDEQINKAIKGPVDIEVISKSLFRMNAESATMFTYIKPYLKLN